MLRRLLGIVMVMAAVSAAVPAVAGASAYQQVLSVYESQGAVPACRFSGPELADALKGVDSYGAQYFADFTQAVQSALSARAAGACTGAVAPAPVRVRGGVAEPPAHFGSITAATSAGVPAPLAVLAGLALVTALFGAGAMVVGSRTRH